MPTAAILLSATPTQVTITAGSSYLLHNPWGAPIYVSTVTGSTAPTGLALSARFVIPPREFVNLATATGESLWAWCDDPQLPDGPAAGRLIYAGPGAVTDLGPQVLASFSGTAGSSAPFRVGSWTPRSPRVDGGSGQIGINVENAGATILLRFSEQNSDTFNNEGRYWVLKVNGSEVGRGAVPRVSADTSVSRQISGQNLAANDAVVLEIWNENPPSA